MMAASRLTICRQPSIWAFPASVPLPSSAREVNARTGRATEGGEAQGEGDDFNSRAHGARDRLGGSLTSPMSCFNSRAHGARDSPGKWRASATNGFNSRAHGARDPTGDCGFNLRTVSIHARTGRATFGGIP